MADEKITDLSALAVTPAAGDLLEIVDVSDTSTAPAGAGGSNKQITWTNLLSIGSAVQAWDADLDAFAALTSGANLMPYYTGSHTMSTADFLAWGTWAATWGNLGPGNPGGAGTAFYQYAQVGKTVVANFQLTLGITGTVGTNPTISLPVTSDSSMTQMVMGRNRLTVGGTQYVGHMAYFTTTTALFRQYNSATASLTVGTVTATLPATWAAGDALSGQMIYRAA